jgi:MFS family permease
MPPLPRTLEAGLAPMLANTADAVASGRAEDASPLERLTQTMDIYCERTSLDFWAEPLNAWTNGAFLIAAALILPRLWAIEGRREAKHLITPTRVLLVELVAIALGSFAFHTYATPLAGMADVGSIAAFIFTFLAVYLGRVLKLRPVTVGAICLGIFAASIGLPGLTPSTPIPGFIATYFPPTLAAVAMGLVAMRRGIAGGPYLIAGAGLFVVSMIVAALDKPLCPQFPYGTHFIWHILNAGVLYLMLLGLLATVFTHPAENPGRERDRPLQ